MVTRYRDANQNLRTTFDKIVKRAGLIMLPIGWGTTWGTRHAKLRKMVKPSQQKTPRKLNVFRGLAAQSAIVRIKQITRPGLEHLPKTLGKCRVLKSQGHRQGQSNRIPIRRLD